MTRSPIERAKEVALERLLAIPGVTAVGLGPKIVAGNPTGEISIIVFTRAKTPLEAIPAEQRIPSEIDGFKTDVIEADTPRHTASVPLEPLEDSARYKTLRGGLKIAGGGQDGSGTLGCIAETTAAYVSGAGRIVLLTNQHVLFGEQPEDVTPHCNISVGQPDQACCCTACDFWGDIVAHIRCNAVQSPFVDGALAELKPGTVWRPEIEDEDGAGNPAPIPIAGVVSPDLSAGDIAGGYAVWKRGMRTRKTTGKVIAVNTSFPGKPTSIVISPDLTCPYPATTLPGASQQQPVFDFFGDSGSVLMNTANSVVGLIWAVDWDPKTQTGSGFGYACPIGHVQDELNIAIKTTANTPAGDQTVPATNDTKTSPKVRLPLDDRLILPAGGPQYASYVRPSDARRDVLLRTAKGQEYVALALAHRDELLRLVRTNRRVATVWHRNHGPQMLRSLAHFHEDLPLPLAIEGEPVEACLTRIADIFQRYGSPELRAEIERRLPEILLLAHKSFDEILARFHEELAVAG